MQTDQEAPTHLSLSPTFNSHSSGGSSMAEIAARVVRELGEEPYPDVDNYDWESQGLIFHFQETLRNVHARESDQEETREDNVDDNGDEDEFEFAVLCREPDASTKSANEIFYNGQIRPVYPVFNVDLLLNNGSQKDTATTDNFKAKPTVRRLPLRMLMNEERETTSSSSSEADDLEGVPSDMYCVWSPKTEETSPGRCKKSSSTGSSNRWKLRNLLNNYNRSKSEGEDTLVFWTSSNRKGDRAGDVSKEKEGRSGIDVSTATSPGSGRARVPAHKAHYGRNGAMKEADKRRSYLPYRQGLVGCVADVNATTKHSYPF